MRELSEEEILRYSRHIILPEMGGKGQKKLLSSRVLLVGAGGLGSPAALYLAAAGVGTLGIVDADTVDLSNLQRQVVHGTEDVGRRKVDSARESLKRVNPGVEVRTFPTRITAENVRSIIREFDVVVDGCDNFTTRYLVNDACVLEGKANAYGSIFRFDGQASFFSPRPDSPCYRCLFPEAPPLGMVPSCQEAGVLGVLPGIIGTIQATEAIKYLLTIGKTLQGKLLLYDALHMEFTKVEFNKDPGCAVCGSSPHIKEIVPENYPEWACDLS